MHLEVSSDGAPADVDELRHVIVGVKGPNAALQVEVLVELNSLGLPDVGVELVWAVISRPQGDAVIGYIVQETRLCGSMLLKFGLKQTRFSSEDSQDVCVFMGPCCETDRRHPGGL